jgi:hypothetical protein
MKSPASRGCRQWQNGGRFTYYAFSPGQWIPIMPVSPHRILAQQHYEGLKELVGPMGIRIGFLSGSVTGKTRKTILDMLKHGELHFLIGTHAILEPGVVFKNLGLAITDEQHRFGVAQRAALWKKSAPYPPHVLVMTATPIPRTLALTIYGDLDISIIDELPPGRKPITTELWYEINGCGVRVYEGANQIGPSNLCGLPPHSGIRKTGSPESGAGYGIPGKRNSLNLSIRSVWFTER